MPAASSDGDMCGRCQEKASSLEALNKVAPPHSTSIAAGLGGAAVAGAVAGAEGGARAVDRIAPGADPVGGGVPQEIPGPSGIGNGSDPTRGACKFLHNKIIMYVISNGFMLFGN